MIFTFENDIAILRIYPGISEWTNSVFSACMPMEPSSEYAGDTVTVSGWGLLLEGRDEAIFYFYLTLLVQNLVTTA